MRFISLKMSLCDAYEPSHTTNNAFKIMSTYLSVFGDMVLVIAKKPRLYQKPLMPKDD